MGDMMKKQIAKFESDYDEIFSKGSWTKDDLEMMKDLQKLMYYIEVRCAMKEGEEYPGSEYMDQQSYDMAHSYARNQARSPSTGRFMSSEGRRSGNYSMNNGPWYYDGGNNTSGRRYYDGEKDNAVNELRRMMESKNDPEIRMALQDAIHHLEMK